MRFSLVFCLALLPGCGLLYDFQPPDDAGGAPVGFDAGILDGDVPDASDAGQAPADGSTCGEYGQPCTPTGANNGICLNGRCEPSVCGDLYVDERIGETCELDDPECVNCGLDDCACPDVVIPCREAVCSGSQCLFAPVPDDTPCATDNGASARCIGGLCRLATCGDGVTNAGEECDDGNDVDNDGCEVDCTYSCADNSDCDDFNDCNGIERCAGATAPEARACVAGSPPALPDCYLCDAERGAYLPDADGDGWADDVGQTCSRTDCDDGDASVHPGAGELCGDGIDNDCDPSTTDLGTALACGADGDGDGWPGVGPVSDGGCGVGCPSGTAPVRTNAGVPLLDCDDGNALVNPGQRMFFTTPRCTPGDPSCPRPYDYNCDDTDEREETRVERCALLEAPCHGSGWVGTPPACGVGGRFAECRIALVCAPFASDRTQGCR